jgi:hypothetical protein
MVTQGTSRHGRGNEAFGILLVLFGVVFLIAQWFNFDVGHYGWPLLVIVPGVLLLVSGMFVRASSGGVLVTLGSITTTVGLILFFQNTTDLWATWAYAWALIPAGVGLGQLVHGVLHGHSEGVRLGTRMLVTSLALFVAGAFFFELVVGISGFGFATRWGANLWPLLLIGLGALLLARSFMQGESIA